MITHLDLAVLYKMVAEDWAIRCAAHRACFHATLHELHAAQLLIVDQRRQIREMREERERYARSVFCE